MVRKMGKKKPTNSNDDDKDKQEASTSKATSIAKKDKGGKKQTNNEKHASFVDETPRHSSRMASTIRRLTGWRSRERLYSTRKGPSAMPVEDSDDDDLDAKEEQDEKKSSFRNVTVLDNGDEAENRQSMNIFKRLSNWMTSERELDNNENGETTDGKNGDKIPKSEDPKKSKIKFGSKEAERVDVSKNEEQPSSSGKRSILKNPHEEPDLGDERDDDNDIDDADDDRRRSSETKKYFIENRKKKRQPSDDRRSTSSSESITSDESNFPRLTRAESIFLTNLSAGNVFIYMVIPPDGGYGWLIVIISFLCQVIVDGIIFSVGIIMPFIADDLHLTDSRIALLASMQIGFYFLSGPVSCAFINKYGFRPVALVGTLISCITITIASFSTNLYMLIVFYSIIGGPALSAIWVASQLIIGYYFDKFRPIANGLSCSGAGAGILIFSYMNSLLVPLIGWRNNLLVYVGFLLTILLMGITYIEVTPSQVGQVVKPRREESDSESDTESNEEVTEYRFSSAEPIRYSHKIVLDKELEKLMVEYKKPEFKPRNWWQRKFDNCCLWLPEQVSQTPLFEKKRYVVRNDPMEKQDLYYMGPPQYEHRPSYKRYDLINGVQVEFVKNDRRAQSISHRLSMVSSKPPLLTAEKRLTYRQLSDQRKWPFWAFISPANWLPKKIVRAFKILFDMRLLRMLEFQVLLASAFLYPMGFNIPFVYSKIRVDLLEHSASLISPAIGLSNFAFRIASGFMAYKYQDYTTYICGGGITLGGAIVLVSAFYGIDMFWFQMVYGVIYGIAPAFYSTLRAIIYVRYLGLEKLTNAFGLTGMAMGAGVFMGTTFAGFLNEMTGSYRAAFVFGGICIMLAGILKCSLPTLMAWMEHKRLRKQKLKFVV